MSNSFQPHELYSSWNSSGQNTGVGSHSLLNPGTEPRSPTLRAYSLPAEPTGKPSFYLGWWLKQKVVKNSVMVVQHCECNKCTMVKTANLMLYIF